MQQTSSTYLMNFTPADSGWTWRVTPPHGDHVSGQEADLESARRTAAFAEAFLRSLERARRRRV